MIQVELDDQAVKAALDKLEQAAVNLTPALTLIGRKLVESTEQRFVDKRGPDGRAWTGNADSTIERKGFDHPLVGGDQDGESGRRTQMLQQQNHAQVEDNVLVVGNVMEYSAMQHFGGSKAQYPHLWGDIPARPFIGLSAEDREMVVEQLSDHLQRAAQGK